MPREVPDGWRVAKLSEVAKCQMGETLIEKDLTGSGIPVFSAGNSDEPWGWTSHSRKKFRRGTIVVGARGTLGNPRLPDHAEFISTQTTIAIHPSPECEPKFLLYCLTLANLSGRGAKQAIPMLTVKNVNEVSVTLPPLTEQRRIADILSSVDEAIQATQAVIEQTRTVKKGVLQRLLTKGIGHTRFKQTEIGEIPEAWKARPIAEVCRLSGGSGFPIKHQGRQDLPHPFVKVSDMNLPGNERVVSRAVHTIDDVIANLLQARLFPEGTVIFPKVGAALLTNKRRILGRPAFADNNIMTAVARPEINTTYLYHLFCGIDLSEHVQAGAVPSVNQGTVGSIIVSVPPLSEQEKIVERLAALDATEEFLAQEQTERMILKSALMNDLFTGRASVAAAADLPLAAK